MVPVLFDPVVLGFGWARPSSAPFCHPPRPCSVSVRVRPLNKQEQNEGFTWRIENNSMFQIDAATREPDRARDAKYALDHVFGPGTTTSDIYAATTQHLITKLVSGFNSTVFAYGQTSSGKTYTMRGGAREPGIIPLAVREVFALIEHTTDREFLLRVSYMELYNEEVNDLLAPENMRLPIHESKEAGVYVAGLREDIVTSPEQARGVLQLLEDGEANRHVGSTRMNEGSSRSHTVFRMVIESRSRGVGDLDALPPDDAAGAILVSTLTLVDLAGSERVAKTGAEGIRMKEGTAINKSLLTLGTVINKLSEGAQLSGAHIPYRDSKLTRILQPSLGGNAKTAIICNVTPAGCHTEESHSTLRFACRAKRVVNNAVVNEVVSDAAVLKRQAKEIEELKQRLADSGLSGCAARGGGARAVACAGVRARVSVRSEERPLLRS
ncbi:MAG: P-loop containing nucleoside triphosphate hydrolase protein [Monoraphidium minutum]|nr:MAG: P-loop containing nucleoside triphosphate hydrolase protein [Monoraphidium minutum]